MRAVMCDRSPARAKPSATRNSGMSLIECLVALLVLTIGLMGMASLMLQGLRTGYLALVRTQAVNLVSDMAERIRANPDAAAAYDCGSYTGGPSEQGCAPTDSSSGTSCSSTQLAQDDLARWQGSARAMLPLVSSDLCAANVVYTAPGASDEPQQYRISVSWNEPGELTPLVHQSDLLVSPP
jgi:type IV pilus modification protein PilV